MAKLYRLDSGGDTVAVRLSKQKDKCGQSPYLFLTGPWNGDVVWVDHKKMRRAKRERQ